MPSKAKHASTFNTEPNINFMLQLIFFFEEWEDKKKGKRFKESERPT